MATTTSYELETTWRGTSGNKFTRNFKHLDGENATSSDVKDFTLAYIANGDFLKEPPAECLEAARLKKERTTYDLS